MRSEVLCASSTDPTTRTWIEPGDRVRTLTSLTGTVLALWGDYAWLAIDTVGDDEYASTHKIDWLEPLAVEDGEVLSFAEDTIH